MRVLTLVPDAFGGHGGIAKFNRDLIESIAALPEVAEVVVLPRQVPFEPGPLPAKVDFRVCAAGGKARFVKAALMAAAEGFDLVVCGHVNLLGLAAAVNLKLRASLILIVHGIEVWAPHRSWLTRRALHAVSAVWSVSAFTRDRLAAWSGIDLNRFTIVPNCVDLAQFGPRPRNTGLQQRWGLEGRQVVLTLARLAGRERYKGVDEMLGVLPRLVQQRPGLVYVVAGDGEDRARLERKAKDLGIAEFVRFVGFVEERDKADLYRLADLFVMPGRGEGFGIVYLESLACGVPVVASKLDGSREAVLNGELGRLVDPSDPEDLLRQVVAGLDDPHGVPAKLEHYSRTRYQMRVAEAVKAISHNPGAGAAHRHP